MNNLVSKLQILGSELVLGSLIAILSVLTALAGYQGSMADSEQTTSNVQGQQRLTNANAEYLTATQLIVYNALFASSRMEQARRRPAAGYADYGAWLGLCRLGFSAHRHACDGLMTYLAVPTVAAD
ncbi:MAG: hypothetical protein ACUVRJ_10935 [Candidatus Villigracilaceae bacterium]